MWVNGTWTTSDFLGSLPAQWKRRNIEPNATREYVYNNSLGGVMQYKSPVQINSTVVVYRDQEVRNETLCKARN